MTLRKAINVLEQHYGWREGYHANKVDSIDLTNALRLILDTLKEFSHAAV
jgi:hypothetical protein